MKLLIFFVCSFLVDGLSGVNDCVLLNRVFLQCESGGS